MKRHKYGRLTIVDIETIIKLLRQKQSNRAIAGTLGIHRKSVAKIRAFFDEHEALQNEEVPLAELFKLYESAHPKKKPGPRSQMERWEGKIDHYLGKGLTPRLIYQKLAADPAFELSESAVYRYVTRKRKKKPAATVRVETKPGEEAQVDFGAVGKLVDDTSGQEKKAYVFSMVLSWSRHMYGELVFDQTLETWLGCHERAFAWFGGVAERVKIDNLKAGITKACAEDPQVQRDYGAYATHAGFRIDPCRPYTPQHKGKVERGGISYIKSSFIPLLEEGTSLNKGNELLQKWLMETAGERKHGTTGVKPLLRFAEEMTHLQPLPTKPFELARWKRCKVANDGHIRWEKNHYSVPCRLVGETVQVKATAKQVEVYDNQMRFVAVHSRVSGDETHQWITLRDHLPPQKAKRLDRSRDHLLQRAAEIGPLTVQAVTTLLDERPLDRTDMVLNLLDLAETYSPQRLEVACERGLFFGDVRSTTLKRMLKQGLDRSPIPHYPTPDGGCLVYARSGDEFLHTFMALAQVHTPQRNTSIGGGR